MQKRLAELMKEETAANRRAESERAKLEEQISMLKQTLEVETSKRLTAEQELGSSIQQEFKRKITLLEDDLKTQASRWEAELASSQQVRWLLIERTKRTLGAS